MTDSAPLVTFALFTYNHEAYVRDAVRGALAQDYSPLEIIISDDCSTDGTFDIITAEVAAYAGPHTVHIRQPERNFGVARSVSDVSRLASGAMIVAAAGDDISKPERTSVVVAEWQKQDRRSGSIYSHFDTLHPDGTIKPPPLPLDPYRSIVLADRDLVMINDFSGLSGCAHAWTKDLFDEFGPIDDRIDHEDIIIPLRALLLGSITFLQASLVIYRLTHGSITRKKYGSVPERMAKMKRYWRGREAIFDQFDADLKRPVVRNANAAADIDWLAGECARGRKYAALISGLYGASRPRQLLTALNPFVSMPRRERAKWLAIAVSPNVYGKSRGTRTGVATGAAQG